MRPGMYIGKIGDGSSHDDGIYVLIKEIIDKGELEIRDDFKIYWKKFPIAKLYPGKDYLNPELSLIIDDIIEMNEQKNFKIILKNG